MRDFSNYSSKYRPEEGNLRNGPELKLLLVGHGCLEGRHAKLAPGIK